MVDGVTTFATVKKQINLDYYTSSGNVFPDDRHSTSSTEFRNRSGGHADGQIAGSGSSIDTTVTTYVNKMGGSLKNEIRRAYVIGFSNISEDLNSVNDIASAVGASPSNVFRAGSQEELEKALEEIKNDIINDFWFLKGPSY